MPYTFPVLFPLGLTQTGDKSPYYKQITLERHLFLKSSVVRSSAIHCTLCKSYPCNIISHRLSSLQHFSCYTRDIQLYDLDLGFALHS